VGFNHTRKSTVTRVLLDPPWAGGESIYDATEARHRRKTGRQVKGSEATRPRSAREAAAWAFEHGDDRRLRIVLRGRVGEHNPPRGWRKVKAGRGELRLSPGCLPITASLTG
jgi:hypothetical protein